MGTIRCSAFCLATTLILSLLMIGGNCNGLQAVEMIRCAQTGHNIFDYNGYGRYCGLGNCGGKPIDPIDRCCQKHDNCYGELMKPEGGICSNWSVYLSVYKTITPTGEKCPICAHLSLYDKDDSKATCKHSVCKCDQRLTTCLKTHAKSFKSSNIGKCSVTDKGVNEMKALVDEVEKALGV